MALIFLASLFTIRILTFFNYIDEYRPTFYFLMSFKRLRWSRVSVLAFGTQVFGFNPDRSRWIFQGVKILSTPSFGGEVKPSVPCRRFTGCKISLNVTWKLGIGHFSPM